MGYIPQRIEIERENPIRLIDFLLLTEQRVPMWIRPLPSRRRKAVEAMERVGVAKLKNQPIGKLSGGELQRSMLAKVILSQPDVVLMDEPVSGIDVSGGELFCELLEDLKEEHRFTLVLTSHDLSVVSNHATEVICINRTLKCTGPPVEVLTPDSIQELYGPNTGLVKHHDHFKEGRHSSRL
ncbi:MAG: ATP-binding cassette domain-containing protein [Planctomycetota bacterium]|nr:ATP-binding cassette domain-containing protein [Planctomycetota bacterium]